MNNREYQMKNVQKEAFELFSKKNKDYGDSFATYGTVGVMVRIGDKLQRLVSVSKNGGQCNVLSESLRDTLIDLHNYAAMGIMLLDEKKESSTELQPHPVADNNLLFHRLSERSREHRRKHFLNQSKN